MSKCELCGKEHRFFISGKKCFDEEIICWLVDNTNSWGANWCLLKRHFLNELREAGYDIVKRNPEQKKKAKK